MTNAEGMYQALSGVNSTARDKIVRTWLLACSDEDAKEWRKIVDTAKHRRAYKPSQREKLPLEQGEPTGETPFSVENAASTNTPSPSPHPSPNPPSFPTSTSPQNPPIIPQSPETPQAAQGEDFKKKEAKSKRREQLTGYSLRLNPLFRRRPTTLWTDNEKIALAKLLPAEVPFPDEDFDLLLRFYSLPKNAFPIGRDGKPEDYRRHDMVTLLNNWSGEVGKAQKHFEESNIVPMQTAEQEERAEAHARRRRLFGS